MIENWMMCKKSVSLDTDWTHLRSNIFASVILDQLFVSPMQELRRQTQYAKKIHFVDMSVDRSHVDATPTQNT